MQQAAVWTIGIGVVVILLTCSPLCLAIWRRRHSLQGDDLDDNSSTIFILLGVILFEAYMTLEVALYFLRQY